MARLYLLGLRLYQRSTALLELADSDPEEFARVVALDREYDLAGVTRA